jgi:hypothetical protein
LRSCELGHTLHWQPDGGGLVSKTPDIDQIAPSSRLPARAIGQLRALTCGRATPRIAA